MKNFGIFLWMSGKRRVRQKLVKNENRRIELVATVLSAWQEPHGDTQHVEFACHGRKYFGKTRVYRIPLGQCIRLNGYWKQGRDRSIYFEILSWNLHIGDFLDSLL